METATKTIAPETPVLPYMAQLDALRAFAVAAVLIHHYTPGGWGYGAYAGVKLFFTISGFLITGILLRSRDAADAQHQKRLGSLAKFYARRFLRIFPLYYFVVAVAFAINLEPSRKIIGWLLTYTLNIHMAQQGWFEANFAHFWSLSVEEQFYICWPWLALFLPRKLLFPAGLAMISAGPLFRLSYILSGYKNMTGLATYISTPSSLDHLGAGVVLAMFTHMRAPCPASRRYLNRVILPVLLAGLILVERWGTLNITLLLHDPLQAAVFCCIVYNASLGPSSSCRR